MDRAPRIEAVLALLAVAGIVVASAAARATGLPISASAPTIAGDAYVGKTLTSSTGVWRNSPTRFSYQWARCDRNGNHCVAIASATSQRYTAGAADVKHKLEAAVTATNSAGTAGPVISRPSATISLPLPPRDTSPPRIVGKPLVGEQVFVEPGGYAGGAVASFAYQWQLCAPAALVCVNITGAIGQSYIPVKGAIVQRLRVHVTATNPFGATTTTSEPTARISVPVVTLSTTLAASRSSTICCQRVELTGRTSRAMAGESIVILARQYDDIVSLTVATTTTDATGRWSVKVTPMIQTTYTAQAGTSASPSVTVAVHPRVGFGINGNTFTAKVTGRDSFAGSVAWFEERTRAGSWRRIAVVVINQLSVAKFHLALGRGHIYTLRIYLPRQQAGPGYLDGTSHAKRVGGTA